LSKTTPFADRLLAWWDRHGRTDLPWQHPRSPYRVWVSEIMLQQTQVSTVIPYFERWMERFPDLQALANADQDQVLAAWAGLGYYARARNLHKAARICRDEHGGELPCTPAGLADLPGIGQSTANAIVSQAHDLPLPILDGNAKRVLARHAAISGWPGKSKTAKALWAEAESRLPDQRGADHTQAIMDLGATLCTRTRPRCSDCPVSTDCRALAEGDIESYPGRKPATAVPEMKMFMLVARGPGGEVLMERRPPAGIWGGLWCLPQADGEQELASRFGLDPAGLHSLANVEHRLTHRLLKIHPLGTREGIAMDRVECDQGLAWKAPEDWRRLGLPKPVSLIISNLDGGSVT
jgi:A/G-specific adenine glycosylase